MITDPKTAAWLDLLDPGDPEPLEALRAEASAADVPVISRAGEALLKTVIAMTRPGRVLEVGTAVGFSALMMCSVLPEDAGIDTIEHWGPRIREAEKNIGSSAYRDRIRLIAGDAGEILPGLPQEHYDLIFMDAAKGQYKVWLPHLLKCLKTGGVLFSDNVLQGGTIAESRFALDRRERTIHARMREYLRILTHTEGLVTSVIPCGDGAAVTVKTAKEVFFGDGTETAGKPAREEQRD